MRQFVSRQAWPQKALFDEALPLFDFYKAR
jgi:hypothetical protein